MYLVKPEYHFFKLHLSGAREAAFFCILCRGRLAAWSRLETRARFSNIMLPSKLSSCKSRFFRVFPPASGGSVLKKMHTSRSRAVQILRLKALIFGEKRFFGGFSAEIYHPANLSISRSSHFRECVIQQSVRVRRPVSGRRRFAESGLLQPRFAVDSRVY